jgi:hypothetical protein
MPRAPGIEEDTMAKQKKTAASAPIRCACGREELLTPAIPQPADAGGESQTAQDERPGPPSEDTAVTAGPVTRREERN